MATRRDFLSRLNWEGLLLGIWLGLAVVGVGWALFQTYDGRNLRTLTRGLTAANGRALEAQKRAEVAERQVRDLKAELERLKRAPASESR